MLKTLFTRKINLFLILFMLTSCGGGGGGGSSDTADNQTSNPSQNTPPTTPTNLTATAGYSQIILSWDSVADATYNVYYAQLSFAGVEVANYATLTGGTKITGLTSDKKIITDLSNGTKYYFVVTAVVNNLESAKSTEVNATPVATPLNDTGITWGGDYSSGNNSNCTSNISAPQDCNQGRDAQALTKTGDGHAGFDFWKLGADGSVLSIQNGKWADNGIESNGTKWSCVKDNHTGLVWEVKTNDGSIHDKDNTYKWGGITAIGRDHASTEKGTYYDDWNTLVNGANQNNYGATTGLCGFTDWRVPSYDELVTIINHGKINPAIDGDYFPNTSSNWFWSSSPYAYNSDGAWIVHFSGGYDSYGIRSSAYRVRLVRAGQ